MNFLNRIKFDVFGQALHHVPAEIAHDIAVWAFKSGLSPGVQCPYDLRTEFAGLVLPNPIGFAAGFDKNGIIPDEILHAGFGFVECGTVTPKPQSGNPKPRLFRLKEDRAIINRMGFNNVGLEEFAHNLRVRAHKPGIVGSNIGANKDSVDKINDYVTCLRKVWLHSSYVAINISSPNTKGLRDLQSGDILEELLGRLNEERAFLKKLHGHRPLFLKVAPDLQTKQIADISKAVKEAKIDALIVSNTTISRPTDLISKFATEQGGLSGRPLVNLSTEILRAFKSEIGDALPLMGVGGILNGDDAVKKLEAGATALQIYTGYIYRGPRLLKEVFDSVAQYRGSKSKENSMSVSVNSNEFIPNSARPCNLSIEQAE